MNHPVNFENAPGLIGSLIAWHTRLIHGRGKFNNWERHILQGDSALCGEKAYRHAFPRVRSEGGKDAVALLSHGYLCPKCLALWEKKHGPMIAERVNS